MINCCCSSHPEAPEPAFRLPHVAPPGNGQLDPHAIGCTLPGGRLCTCAVPSLSASDVRTALARTLAVPLTHIAPFSLLWSGVGETDIQLWDENLPLPPEIFFAWGTGRPNFHDGTGHRRRVTVRRPMLELRRLVAPTSCTDADGHSEDDGAVSHGVILLESEQLLEDLANGVYPPELLCAAAADGGDRVWLDACALAMIVRLGQYDPAVHTARLLASVLPRVLPAIANTLRGRHEELLARHEALSVELTRRATDSPSGGNGGAASTAAALSEKPRGSPGSGAASGAGVSSRAARLELIARVRRALPDLPVATEGGHVPAPVGRVSLSKCVVLGGVKLGRPPSPWATIVGAAEPEHVLAIGIDGVVLYPCARPPNAPPARSEAPERHELVRTTMAATLVPWQALRQWKCSIDEVELTVAGRAHATKTYRLRTTRAPMIGCVLQAHAPAGSASDVAASQPAEQAAAVTSATIERV